MKDRLRLHQLGPFVLLVEVAFLSSSNGAREVRPARFIIPNILRLLRLAVDLIFGPDFDTSLSNLPPSVEGGLFAKNVS